MDAGGVWGVVWIHQAGKRVDAGGVWGVVWIHQAGKRVDAGGVWGVVWITSLDPPGWSTRLVEGGCRRGMGCGLDPPGW